jgi:hypothetical protein
MLELLAAILSEFAFSAGPCRAELLNYLSLLTLALAFGEVISCCALQGLSLEKGESNAFASHAN